ncbi:hypothetical protein EOPP23_09310 [Endozoicomonas sp. OPT23]|nr:hypothetical protein [Endozoicomonas sp. OPT23]
MPLSPLPTFSGIEVGELVEGGLVVAMPDVIPVEGMNISVQISFYLKKGIKINICLKYEILMKTF